MCRFKIFLPEYREELPNRWIWRFWKSLFIVFCFSTLIWRNFCTKNDGGKILKLPHCASASKNEKVTDLENISWKHFSPKSNTHSVEKCYNARSRFLRKNQDFSREIDVLTRDCFFFQWDVFSVFSFSFYHQHNFLKSYFSYS